MNHHQSEPRPSLSIEKETEARIKKEAESLEQAFIARGSRQYKATVLALFSAGFATFALLYCVQPLLPVFSTSFAIQPAQASLVLSSATAAMALGILITGPISDAYGRKSIMSLALLCAAFFTLAGAIMPNWPLLLASRILLGISLAGFAAIGMTYLGEELTPEALGTSMGIYISGNALGGMSGRLISGVLADFLPWRGVLLVLGLIALAAAVAFIKWLPASRNFVPRKLNMRNLINGYTVHFKDQGLPWLFFEGFLLMGAFVTLFNYIGYRLLAPPYAYSQTLVGLISIVYLSGIYSSPWAGSISERFGRRNVLWGFIALMAAGISFTLCSPILLILLGVLILTFGFFAAHSTASSWVGKRAKIARGQAASLYLFAYYAGSSLAGTAGGIFWHRFNWPGVAGFILLLLFIAFWVGWFRLHRLAPKPPHTA